MKRISKILRNAVPLAALLLSACLGDSGGSTAPSTSTTGYTIGGAVTGLNGSVVLQNNGGDNLTVSANGNFTFATKAKNGSAYSVSVLTQPAGQTCSVSTGAGTVIGNNVNTVAVTCSANSYTVGGTISGLSGTVVLQDNGGDNLTVAVNGTFSFATKVADGSPYTVSVLTQPSIGRCSVKNGSGKIAGGNVTSVGIICAHQQGGAIQGVPLALAPTVSTLAGIVGTFVDGTGTAARFNNPYASVSDGTNLYVVDQMNNAIRKIVIATGVVTTLAGSPAGTAGAADGTGTAATFNTPTGIATDGTNLYVVDQTNNKIRKIVIATGAVSSFTGTANTAMATGAADGAASAATFNFPVGITSDGTNLYVTDTSNNKIRQIVIATGVVSSLTGTANTMGAAGPADGAGATATFNGPYGIATDNTNLYVADWTNNKIRKIVIATGVVSSVTGTASTTAMLGATDGAGSAALFSNPSGIATDGTNLYVTDVGNNKIRKIVIATGAVSSLTGAPNTMMAAGKLNGSPSVASLSGPYGISYDATSNSLFVADKTNNDLRQITLGASSTVTTLAGIMGPDGTGGAATFLGPQAATTDGTNLYIADTNNNTIRKIVIATGAVTTLAGQTGVAGAADGTGTAATFNFPYGITTDGTNLYVVDTFNNKIRQIVIATGVVSSLTGTANTAMSAGAADGAGATASFWSPYGITTDGTNLYVVDQNNGKIRKIVIATGVVSSLTGTANTAMAIGAADGAGTAAKFFFPFNITTDGTNLYVADAFNNKIRQIVIATGVVSSLTGAANTAGAAGAADGVAAAATFSHPYGITTDGTNLYVADTLSNKIRQIVIATGVVSSLTGTANTAGTVGSADGAGAAAKFNAPSSIITDGSNLYVTDGGNTIRKIQ